METFHMLPSIFPLYTLKCCGCILWALGMGSNVLIYKKHMEIILCTGSIKIVYSYCYYPHFDFMLFLVLLCFLTSFLNLSLLYIMCLCMCYHTVGIGFPPYNNHILLLHRLTLKKKNFCFTSLFTTYNTKGKDIPASTCPKNYLWTQSAVANYLLNRTRSHLTWYWFLKIWLGKHEKSFPGAFQSPLVLLKQRVNYGR